MQTSGSADLLDRVGLFRTEAFDLLDSVTRLSTRTRGNSALPEATSEMQCLVNILGDVERLLSHQQKRPAAPLFVPPEGR